MAADSPIEFGTREKGKHYQPRPGSYAVVLGERDTVAVMRTENHGYCLPGGGADPGESVEATLRREVLEECGHEVEMMEPIGVAVEYLYAEAEGYFAKQCSFFRVKLGALVSSQSEQDHTLIWLPMSEAVAKLNHLSQRWALSQVRHW